MPDGNDQEALMVGDRLLREIVWALDRHGIEIIERQPTCWILRAPSGRDSGLQIENFVRVLGRNRTLRQQRRHLAEMVAMIRDGGGAGGSVSKA